MDQEIDVKGWWTYHNHQQLTNPLSHCWVNFMNSCLLFISFYGLIFCKACITNIKLKFFNQVCHGLPLPHLSNMCSIPSIPAWAFDLLITCSNYLNCGLYILFSIGATSTLLWITSFIFSYMVTHPSYHPHILYSYFAHVGA